MKLMKKAMKCLVAVFMMAMAFVATGVTAEAAEMVARTFDNNLEDVSVIKAKDLSCFGEPGVFDGEAVDGLMQTEATSTSVTISWNPAYGAIGYYVGEVGQDGYVIESSLISVDTTYVTWPVSEYGAVLAVIPIDVDYEASTSFGAALEVYPLPKKVTGLKVDGGFGNGGKLNVVWNSNVCCGFEAVCYNKKGKVVQTVDEWTYRDATFSKTNSQNIYSVKVRAYNWINGKSKKVYSDYSKTLYAVPQPKITSKKSDLKKNSVNLKWKKVSGATKYDIYMSRSQNSGYKKVATVKSNKKSYKITKFKGKTLNIHNKTHYIKIVTYGKFGKKTVKSSSKPQLSVYTYTTYY